MLGGPLGVISKIKSSPRYSRGLVFFISIPSLKIVWLGLEIKKPDTIVSSFFFWVEDRTRTDDLLNHNQAF